MRLIVSLLITVCFSSLAFANDEESESISGASSNVITPVSSVDVTGDDDTASNANSDAVFNPDNIVYYSPDKDYGEEIVKRYVYKDDILGYFESPVISPLSAKFEGNYLTSYALPYYGNITYFGDQESPLSRFSTGITRFTTKSMAIFDKEREHVIFANSVSNFILNSLLGYFTDNVFKLNIWGSSDISYTSGFEAVIRPFRNIAFSYSYMTEQNVNMTTFQFKFGYNKNSNLAVINANSFGDNNPVNTTTGVEWQFYF